MAKDELQSKSQISRRKSSKNNEATEDSPTKNSIQIVKPNLQKISIISVKIIGCCQKLMDLNVRILFYLVVLFFGGFIREKAPNFFKSIFPFRVEKEHFLNQYLVEMCWFWTVILLIPFQILTRKSIEKKDHLRVILISLILCFSTNILNGIIKCLQLSNLGLDIFMRKIIFNTSQQIYMLIFSNLVLNSEVKLVIGFENLDHHLDKKRREIKKSKNEFSNHNLKFLLSKCALFLLITILSALLEFVLILTIVYDDGILKKIFGFFWPLICWNIFYRLTLPKNLFNFLMMPSKSAELIVD